MDNFGFKTNGKMFATAIGIIVVAIAISTSPPTSQATAAAMSVTYTSFRQRLWQGGKSYGPMLLSDSPVVTEIMSRANYGHVVIDHEHGPTDIRSGLEMLRAMQAATATTAGSRSSSSPPCPIVRIPGHDPVYMKKVLDTLPLPGGVLVPMIEDAATARAVVQSTRYPRQVEQQQQQQSDAAPTLLEGGGIRGCAVPGIRASGFGTQSNYMERAQHDLFVMVQVETLKGVEAISEIATVPGIDAIFIGPYDLSCSLGYMGEFDNPRVQEVLKQAEQAVLDSRQSNNSNSAGCLLAGFRSPGRSIAEMFQTGYSLICGAADVGLIQEAANRDAEEGNSAILSLHGS
jgi:2-keto-3-deoxy-L-rhamnonate aldolase RhmA